MGIRFNLNGRAVELGGGGDRRTLLEALRGELGITSAKDGCAPQGQCGCCTVLVDGKARVACVTPLRRVAGRDVVTLEGLDDGVAEGWADVLGSHGGSQCGFCTPGIVMRLEDRRRRKLGATSPQGSAEPGGDPSAELQRALAAHLCRCTGWQGICEAAGEVLADPAGLSRSGSGRSTPALHSHGDADQRAALEGGHRQRVDRSAILGGGGFAADTVPPGALVAMAAADGEWVLGETLAEARQLSSKVQGRRSTLEAEPPLRTPIGEWDATLRTSWVEPGYLETDASWCEPGGEPADPLANAGAFGGKLDSPLPAIARRLADESGRPVVALWSREDVVRHGPKRPPVAAGMRSDGTGRIDVAATGATFEAIRDAVRSVAPGIEVAATEIAGPATSASIRGAGWAEAFALSTAAGAVSPIGGVDGDAVGVSLATGADSRVRVHAPGAVLPEALVGAVSAERVRRLGCIEVDVHAGDVLDDSVLRSYVIGAVHMAAGWVTSEGLAVDSVGDIHDLTIRSFGILPAAALPPVVVNTHGAGAPVAVSEATFAAAAAAIWRHHGHSPDWPLRTPVL